MLGHSLLALTALAGSVITAPAQFQARTIENVEWTVKNFTRRKCFTSISPAPANDLSKID